MEESDVNQNRRREVQKVQAAIRDLAVQAEPAIAEVCSIIEDALTRAQAVLDSVFDRISIEDLAGDVEGIRDEEQEYYDNMPEGLQNSERGELATANVEQLEESYGKLEELRDLIAELDLSQVASEALEGLGGVCDKLGEAADVLDDAQS